MEGSGVSSKDSSFGAGLRKKSRNADDVRDKAKNLPKDALDFDDPFQESKTRKTGNSNS